MALEESFVDLVVKWRELHEVLQALRITTVEDQPVQGAVLLIERCADATEALLGWSAEGLTAAAQASDAAISAVHDQIRRSLKLSQQRFGCLEDRFLEMTSYRSVSELRHFGRKRRGEWQVWVRTVQDAAARCQQPMREVRQALIRCWQELAERSAATSVSVKTTNIGQQISPRRATSKVSPSTTT